MRYLGFLLLAALFAVGISWLAWRIRWLMGRGTGAVRAPEAGPVRVQASDPLDAQWTALHDANPGHANRLSRARRSCEAFLGRADPNDELAVAIRRSLPLWVADAVPGHDEMPRLQAHEVVELLEMLAAQAERRLIAGGTGVSSAYAEDRAYLEEIERRYRADLR